MKNLYILALVLLVSFAGYSQVKRVPMKNDMCKMTTMQEAGRMDNVNANVQSQPNMVRFDFGSGELDYTTYDWQTNWGNINRTIVWPDGKVSFAYTLALDESFSDQGTGIGTYDYINDEWIPLGGHIEDENTNFGSIARYMENGIVVAAHTNTTCGLYIVENKDNLSPNSIAATSYLNSIYHPTCPVVMTSGHERNIIHIIATGFNDNKLYYFRSSDGGLTWDKENVILPYLNETYGSDWGTNVAYWMETTEDNCLALVVNNTWSDGMVIYSYDDGETWLRKVFYHHPGINTTFNDWFMYPRWASCIWNNNELCTAYEFNCSKGESGSSLYDPTVGGVAFWSESMPYRGSSTDFDPTNPMPPTPGHPFIMDYAYLYNDIYATAPHLAFPFNERLPEYFGYLHSGTTGEFNIEDLRLHGDYNCGICAMPILCKVSDTDDDLVAVWMAMDFNYTDENGNFYYKLFASCSWDGGLHWSPQVNIVNDFMWFSDEHVYPQAAVIDHTLIVACQVDGTTGSYLHNDDNYPEDNFYRGYSYDLYRLFPIGPFDTPEVEHNTHITLYPNPTVDQLNVMLNKNAEVTIYNIMGQTVTKVEGHVGANTIDISNLNSGIYFVSAGSDTQKFVVK